MKIANIKDRIADAMLAFVAAFVFLVETSFLQLKEMYSLLFFVNPYSLTNLLRKVVEWRLSK